MKYSVVFLAPYPTSENIKDGMISRVKAIDTIASDINRAYVEHSFRRFIKKEVIKIDDKTTVYRLNSFIHLFLTMKLLLSAYRIYSHSINGFYHIFFLIPFLRKNVILDIHGVVPEEIRLYMNKKTLSLFFEIIEMLVFKKIVDAICVTQQMKIYYQNKYPNYNGKFHIYSILPNTIPERINIDEIVKNKSQGVINVIYSGGVSKWQNIDLMLDAVSKIQNKECHFLFLVSNAKFVEDKLRDLNISTDIVEVKSVLPEELPQYYLKADYAFILRDDNVVNHVANPTKLVEYFANGIIPIVKCENIGDYLIRGYEYVKLEDFISNPIKPSMPSINNMHLAQKLIKENSDANIQKLFTEVCVNK